MNFGWQRPLPSLAAFAAIIGSGRCQSCPRPLPTEKACPFSLCGASRSLFVVRRLSRIRPISLVINNAHLHVITFLAYIINKNDWELQELQELQEFRQ